MAKSTTDQELLYNKILKLLGNGIINNSFVARAMYPDVKSSSACGKFKNKIDGNGHFRFTDDEKVKLVKIFKGQFSNLF